MNDALAARPVAVGTTAASRAVRGAPCPGGPSGGRSGVHRATPPGLGAGRTSLPLARALSPVVSRGRRRAQRPPSTNPRLGVTFGEVRRGRCSDRVRPPVIVITPTSLLGLSPVRQHGVIATEPGARRSTTTRASTVGLRTMTARGPTRFDRQPGRERANVGLTRGAHVRQPREGNPRRCGGRTGTSPLAGSRGVPECCPRTG